MEPVRNPGRVAGIWYLLLALLGPLRLIYIPSKLFVPDNATATVNNIAAHQQLFRLGIASDVVAAVVLIFLTLSFYRLLAGVDRNLAVLVIIFGGVMPALLYFTGVVADLGALTIIRGATFLSPLDLLQQHALAMLLLKLHDLQNTAAETLWGIWLLPLGLLIYRSRLLPRFLGVWLLLGGHRLLGGEFHGYFIAAVSGPRLHDLSTVHAR
jgi:hypothetical protein